MSSASIIDSSHPIRTATMAAGAVALAGVAATAALVLAVKLWAPPLLAVSAHHSAVVFLVSPAGLGLVAGAGLALTALVAVAVFAKLATIKPSGPPAPIAAFTVWADRINAPESPEPQEGKPQLKLTRLQNQPKPLSSDRGQEVYDVSLADADGSNPIRFRLLLETAVGDLGRMERVSLRSIYQEGRVYDIPRNWQYRQVGAWGDAFDETPSLFDLNDTPIEEQRKALVNLRTRCEGLKQKHQAIVDVLQRLIDQDPLITNKRCLDLESYQILSSGSQYRSCPQTNERLKGWEVYETDSGALGFRCHTRSGGNHGSRKLLPKEAPHDHPVWIDFKKAIGLPVPPVSPGS